MCKCGLQSPKEGAGSEKRQQKLSKAERIALRNQANSENSLVSKIDYLSVHDDTTQNFGEYQLIQSQGDFGKSSRTFASVSSLDKVQEGKDVWIRARVDAIRPKGRNAFLVLRQSQYTLQVRKTVY
jgi:hypothetical protein